MQTCYSGQEMVKAKPKKEIKNLKPDVTQRRHHIGPTYCKCEYTDQ